MEGLQQWALSVCVSVLAAGMFSILIPKGSMEKMLRLVVSVFLIMSFLSPLINQSVSFREAFQVQKDQQFETSRDLEDSINAQMAEQMEAAVRQQITACLEKNGTTDIKVRVVMDIKEDGRIQINEIMILIPDSEQAKRQQIRQAVSTELGLNVTVLLESEV